MNPPWVEILNADLEVAPAPHVAAFATVTAEAAPAVRHVVIRLLHVTGAIDIVTDAASPKAAQLRQNPRAELSLWLAGSRRQYRAAGRCAEVSDQQERGDAWRALSDASRAMFFWPIPGSPADVDSLDPAERDSAATAETPLPDRFALLRLRPEHAELLELAFRPHRRTSWRVATGWRAVRVNA